MRNAEELCKLHSTILVNKYGGFNSYQSFFAFYALQDFLNRHDNIRRVLEFGTAEGGTAIFFGLNMWRRRNPVQTWDVQERQDPDWFELAKFLGIEFKLGDIFTEESKVQIKEFIQRPGTTIVFCDNGNKPLEARTFAPFLKSGDILMAHDWNAEIRATDFSEEMKNSFDYLEQEKFDDQGSVILCMVKK